MPRSMRRDERRLWSLKVEGLKVMKVGDEIEIAVMSCFYMQVQIVDVIDFLMEATLKNAYGGNM
ncbi:hypothetical protein RYX36_022072, partial [Vicia faba]